MQKTRKAVIAVSLIVGFISIVSLITMYIQTRLIKEGSACLCIVPVYLLVPILSCFGLLIGFIVYSMLAETKEKAIARNIRHTLMFLDPDERAVIEKIINNKQISQAAISKELGKVKAHRIVAKLLQKGIIKAVNDGKTKKLRLHDKLEKLFY